MLQQAFNTTCRESRQWASIHGKPSPCRSVCSRPRYYHRASGRFAYNGQTESKATALPRKTHIHPLKTVNKTLKMFERYTHPIIAHEHLQHLPRTVHWLLILSHTRSRARCFCLRGMSRTLVPLYVLVYAGYTLPPLAGTHILLFQI
jgi:hypothetical protein